MDMMRFCMAIAGCAIVTVSFALIIKHCGIKSSTCDLTLGALALIAVPILSYANISLMIEIVTLNNDLPEEEVIKPNESLFLSFIFIILTFMVAITSLFATLGGCCYCCCIAAFCHALKVHRNGGSNDHRQ